MTGKRFTLDTNILVYALDRQAGDRHIAASRIIDQAALPDFDQIEEGPVPAQSAQP